MRGTSPPPPPRKQGGSWLTKAALLLLVFGAYTVVRAVNGWGSPSGPPVGSAAALAGVIPAADARFAAPLPYAVPEQITVTHVGIKASVIRVGVGPGGAIGVPALSDALEAAWFDRGPAPGQQGAAIIDAHVDSIYVPDRRAAFYTLGQVRPGDTVTVTRSDGVTARFTVDAVRLVPKSEFPTSVVYGPVAYAGLRLITCGGGFERGFGYLDNVIVYAHLAGWSRGGA